MRTITTSDQDFLLEISPCDDDEIYYFTEGDCWKLAKKLSDMGLGSVVAIVNEASMKHADHRHVEWCHMALELPDGNYLDAFGLQTAEQLRARWNWVYGSSTTIYKPNLANTVAWEFMVSDQDKDFSDEESLENVAEKLSEWLETV